MGTCARVGWGWGAVLWWRVRAIRSCWLSVEFDSKQCRVGTFCWGAGHKTLPLAATYSGLLIGGASACLRFVFS